MKMDKPKPFIFISGLKSEFGEVRSELKRYFKECHDIDVFIFEESDLPFPKKPIDACIAWGRGCDLFILLAGQQYGYTAHDNTSFTELEYDAAFESNPEKIYVYLKEVQERDPKQEEFVKKIVVQQVYKSFRSDVELVRHIFLLIDDFLDIYKREQLPKPRIKVSGVFDSSGFRLFVTNNNTYPIIMLDPIELDGKKYDTWHSQSRIDAGEGKASHSVKAFFNTTGESTTDDSGKFHMATNFSFDFIGKDDRKYRVICKYKQEGEKGNTAIDDIFETEDEL